MLAESLAGHDKGKVYYLLGAEENICYLTDGDVRPLDRPKKKNIKHVQLIKKVPKEITVLLEDVKILKDQDIKKAIKSYLKNYKES